MPTPEEIAAFKRAFRIAAEAEASVRWDPPSGWFASWHTQTSLAPIMASLTRLETDPSIANIDAILAAIAQLPDAKEQKYDTAVIALRDELTDAREDALAAQAAAAAPPRTLGNLPPPPGNLPPPPGNLPPPPGNLPPPPGNLPPPPGNLPPPPGNLPPPPGNLPPPPGNLPPPPGNLPPPPIGPGVQPTGGAAPDPALPAVLAEFAGWRRKRAKVVADDYSSMVFDLDTTAVGEVGYWLGTVPTTEGEQSAEGQQVAEMSEAERALIDIGKVTIKKIRATLSKGAFNNYGGLPDEIRDAQRIPDDILQAHFEHLEAQQKDIAEEDRQQLAETPAPAWWNSVVEAAALIASKQYTPPRDTKVNDYKLQMACLGRATQEVGGGVCSKLAIATTGELSATLPPGSEIAQVFHNFDHEFVVARTPGSRWFVVDPWCHTPMVVPFSDCSFSPKGVTKFIIIKVVEPSPHPYGIDLNALNWRQIISQAQRETPITATEMAGRYAHEDNVADKSSFDPAMASVGAGKWGP